MDLSGLNGALNTFSTAVVGGISRKVQTAYSADNALALNGQTATQMTSTANAHTDAHANNTSNPHGTTAAQIGAYSSSQIDTAVAALLPSGIVPLSAFGDALGTAIPVTLNTSNKTVNFAAGIPCLIAGQAFTLGAYSLAYATNATTLYYLKLTAGVISIIASAAALPESNTTMYIGKIVTDASGNVTSNTIGRVVRVDVYRVSATAAGSSIAVSNGTPDQSASLAWS